jgi:hypothetical protein
VVRRVEERGNDRHQVTTGKQNPSMVGGGGGLTVGRDCSH